MIYEVGAGGLIAIPPRKYEYHRTALWGPHGTRVGETVIDTNLEPVPWLSTKHERYSRDVYNYVFGFRTSIKHRKGDLRFNYANRAIPIEEEAVTISIDGQGNETYIDNPKGEATVQVIDGGPEVGKVEYERYYRDIPKREQSGKIVVAEIDGVKQIIFEHRKGDIILDAEGNPRIVEPGRIPCPRWFTREDRERPSPRYDGDALYYRSLTGISDALNELTTEDLMALNAEVFQLISGRHQGTVKQVVKSKYPPVCAVYSGGELQFEVFDDEGNLIEALTHVEYETKYGDDEA